MSKRTTILTAAVLALLAGLAPAEEDHRALAPRRPAERPKVEVVFVLDTTGSMSGLIEGAKVKIWAIVNQIVSGKPVPDVRVGLVAYRDRGDAYVTRFTPLTSDLDALYGVLRGLGADGGGDGPESVNEALHVALTKPDWNPGPRVLRTVYLVGDAPPHMDYPQDVKYPKTCEAAARAGIIINTVQCGNMGGTGRVFKDIASRAEGRYFQIAQSGGMVRVETPFDARMSELSAKLSASALFYGDADVRRKARERLEEAEKDMDGATGEARAERAGFLAKSGRVGATDLLALLERREMKLEEMDDKLLPADLRALDAGARRAHVTKLLEERNKLRDALIEIDRKRAEFVKAELAKRGGKGDAFDRKVIEALRTQAAKVGIEYAK